VQGPDHDFSASPMLTKKSNGQDILIIQSKSGMVYAFDPDKAGAKVWEYKSSAGSGLGGQWGGAVDGKLAYFGVNGTFLPTPGGMRAVKIDTGEEVWKQRLGGTFTASLVLVGENIYASNESGQTFVFKANPKQFELVAENKLGDEVYATPAICGGRIYMRVVERLGDQRQEMLYCLVNGSQNN
jgi:outer membrane protein assembly factor BamB